MPRKAPAKRKGPKQVPKDDIPQVYREMLEVEESNARKRPKLELAAVSDEIVPVETAIQTAFDSSESEDDIDWEEVNVDHDDVETPIEAPVRAPIESVSIVLESEKPKIAPKRKARKPLTVAERRQRLDVHKFHLLCLLAHCHIRNHWCNATELHQKLRRLVGIPSKIISQLHPEVSTMQYTRSTRFKEALQMILDTWKSSFSITRLGLQRPHWEGPTLESESFLDVKDFIDEAQTWSGSADYGAQLFCALLRAFGLEARLVCSLQILPFASLATIPSSTDKKVTIRLTEREISQPRHPVFWVEVFDAAYQKWLTIDPVISGTIGKPHVIEPALNDFTNILSYAIAFEESGVARDVTRRYAKAYIAKTRKLRVEVVEKGDRWLNRVMRVFRRSRPMDRDQIEDSQLIQKEISEGMPKRIEDFKGHPIYVLERHLRRDEVLNPRNEAGKVNTGSKQHPKMEPVFRRDNVSVVRSADRWFRLGRQVKIGEQPLKRVKRRARQQDEEVDELIGLYAGYQTELYVPSAVHNGNVPKNGFGNIDIYVPSMIPQGAVHIKSKHGRQAARILRIDCAEAVTGFKFKGRHGTAVTNGVVVAAEFKDAMTEVLRALAYSREQDIAQRKKNDALFLWRRFMMGLNIVERVNQYKKEDEALTEETSAILGEIKLLEEDEPISDLDEIEIVEAPKSKKPIPTPVDQPADQLNDQEMTEDHNDLFEDVASKVFAAGPIQSPDQESNTEIVTNMDLTSDVESAQADLELADQQSLLSEDPEDAEAEPDWLI